MRIVKNELSRIDLFFRNVWMLLAVDPLHKFIFSFLCAVFSLFAAEVMRSAFSRVLIELEGVRYIDKFNMLADSVQAVYEYKEPGLPRDPIFWTLF